ncbi:hypothetical protein [Mycolicibacterium vinylchloridicum]|uniref:hypothetical protein n=1 Tax=Mycolicibacterium vinylchloridicum TaxID=2736928 RepID=UPI0015CE765F|nr:hypothetical protein [Mycolicibacterium vinylchloridicum]
MGFVVVAVLALAIVAVGVTTAHKSKSPMFESAPTPMPNHPVANSTSVTDLLAKSSDFPHIGDNRYVISDLSRSSSPDRKGALDACDKLMWPEKEYSDLVFQSAYYSPPPEHGGQSMDATIYMRDLPALGQDFDATVRDCPSFDIQSTEYGSSGEPIGTGIDRTSLTQWDIPGVAGEHHGYKVSAADISSLGTSYTSPDEYRLVGKLRGITFVVSFFDGMGDGPATAGRDLATLFENQRQRILDAP